jgi:hypothetical protein
VFGAAATFDATVGLERDELRDIFAGHEAEVFVAVEWRDLREAVALEEDGNRADDQMKMFGVGDERKKDQEGQTAVPPSETKNAAR